MKGNEEMDEIKGLLENSLEKSSEKSLERNSKPEEKAKNEQESNPPQQEYGTGWMQLLYTIGMPFRVLIGVACMVAGFQSGGIGVLIGLFGFFYAPACAYMCFSYWKNRWIGVYPKMLYDITVVVLWTECVLACIPIVSAPFAIGITIAYQVYFKHRKYMFVE